jgi:hypothetical protein
VKLIIQIDTDNAAFENPREIERCLAKVCEDIRDQPGVAQGGGIRDFNGNTVGQYQLS